VARAWHRTGISLIESSPAERRFSVPNSVDPKKIEARFVNGEMTLTLPKRDESKPRSVKIKVATA
jgi:HSP20 family molecular chaperone IbpA